MKYILQKHILKEWNGCGFAKSYSEFSVVESEKETKSYILVAGRRFSPKTLTERQSGVGVGGHKWFASHGNKNSECVDYKLRQIEYETPTHYILADVTTWNGGKVGVNKETFLEETI